MSDLPITTILPELLRVLRDGNGAVLVAPPGAGKTTAVAPALIGEGWCSGQVLLLSPRRLAARAAAERMAEQMNEATGMTVGYATRMDSRHSKQTRILVLTEGIFRNRVQDDPELTGVSAVLFDEVHERSLDSDFGLALALDVQAALRPDLRLLAMSATLDGARFSGLMHNCPVIESEGKSWPLDLRHIGRRAEQRIEDDMAAAIRRALTEEEGDLLAFLPGVGEIMRTAERLAGVSGIAIHPLHGSLEPSDQRRALTPAGEGLRKVILATNIAETSLTVPGVRIVVDSGLTRRARYDRAAGVTRLMTEKASQAAVTQRAGRAARQRPGVAYRLWEEAATAGLARFDPPEILESDLSSLLLECLLWGVADPTNLVWIDPPPKAAIGEARRRLALLGALDESGAITAHGRALARLPLEARIAHMLLAASGLGLERTAAEVAVLLSERGLGGASEDTEERLRRWRQDKGTRARTGRALAGRWAAMVARPKAATDSGAARNHAVGLCLALAFPDRVAKRRTNEGEDWISVGGRGFRLDPLSALARAEWLAVGSVQGSAAGARIVLAAPLDLADVEFLFAEQIVIQRTVRFRKDIAGIEAMRRKQLGAITLSSGSDDDPDNASVAAAWIEGMREAGLEILPWPASARAMRRRAAYACLPDLSDEALLADMEIWLPPLVEGRRRLSEIDPRTLSAMLDARLGWEGRKALGALAPAVFVTPMGTEVSIDYDAPGGPEAEVRVQALYGLREHPVIGPDRLPLRLSLTSPAGRPIQTTSDLPGFWNGSWADVAREMRGRYPKHHWPDNPAEAEASLRTKRAQAAAKS